MGNCVASSNKSQRKIANLEKSKAKKDCLQQSQHTNFASSPSTSPKGSQKTVYSQQLIEQFKEEFFKCEEKLQEEDSDKNSSNNSNNNSMVMKEQNDTRLVNHIRILQIVKDYQKNGDHDKVNQY